MIRKLRRRMTLMVIGVLILVSAGIVLAIHLTDRHAIAVQARNTLSILAENSGARPTGRDGFRRGPEEALPDPPDGSENKHPKDYFGQGQPPGFRGISGETAAGLSNYYTITLDENGKAASWTSDRTDLYSDGQAAEIADAVLARGDDSGRIGTQFYRRIRSEDKTLLIVLDARLDYLAAANTLRATILTAAAACVLLSLLAWLLIRRMIRPVEDAFTRQKQFIADASHELKTPLAVIGANAEVLEKEIGENTYLGYIRSEVRRTDALVRNLLTLTRLDRSGDTAEMKRFDLSRALLEVALPFESTVYEAGKTMETDVPEGIVCVGSEDMIKQLTVILLSNALKYSDPGGRILLSLRAKAKQREIRVFNTGEPIPPEDRDKLFDRFWRGDPAHGREDTGGHGLGLAIAKSIAEAHRGRITVESPAGGGTAFTVTFGS